VFGVIDRKPEIDSLSEHGELQLIFFYYYFFLGRGVSVVLYWLSRLISWRILHSVWHIPRPTCVAHCVIRFLACDWPYSCPFVPCRRCICRVVPATGKSLSKVEGHLEFRNVSFAYSTRDDEPVFTNFNLKINAGETVALVGERYFVLPTSLIAPGALVSRMKLELCGIHGIVQFVLIVVAERVPLSLC
jgi:ABC-type multidrug transport system fused ATPase/permease subunit